MMCVGSVDRKRSTGLRQPVGKRHGLVVYYVLAMALYAAEGYRELFR